MHIMQSSTKEQCHLPLNFIYIRQHTIDIHIPVTIFSLEIRTEHCIEKIVNKNGPVSGSQTTEITNCQKTSRTPLTLFFSKERTVHNIVLEICRCEIAHTNSFNISFWIIIYLFGFKCVQTWENSGHKDNACKRRGFCCIRNSSQWFPAFFFSGLRQQIASLVLKDEQKLVWEFLPRFEFW